MIELINVLKLLPKASLIMLSLVVISIIFHEIGHWLVLRFYIKNKEAKVTMWFDKQDKQWHLGVGTDKDYEDLGLWKLRAIYVSGILLGMVPVFIYMALFGWPIVFYLIIYLYCSKKDLRLMMQS